jgi:ATP-dependent RNA helicase SUPV3L1/SUV3
MTDASAITALLGPTNTGKTHHAIERMLEHDSGMIGLPLRLLAREVYDRISAKLGESEVALVTGEEQRVPARPAYWVATVEAMPATRPVDFVAVDEVQLAVHRQRGHVFTARILDARGRKETWLLGAATMRGVLAELVPTAKHVAHPRLSRLGFAGSAALQKVPPRSAIVAFSRAHAYEIAERVRTKRGGCAVVMGALSPRTRNAQVAMYQAGEVDYLVATDAIGMGLNLDLSHVAFAALRKFDGQGARELEDDELAQIAGRAGRWVRDGTFGTLAPLELPMGTAAAIEHSHFPAVKRVRWRNPDLAFDSLDALAQSLATPPTRARGVLQTAPEAEDAIALRLLARRDDVLPEARGEERVRLLWDVCSVPDFRKLLSESHADTLAEVFLALARHGVLSDDFMNARVRGLDDTSGDVETLVARLSAVRTWTYISNRSAWLASPSEWQAATRTLEDRLSDALHARLVLRFVDVTKTRRTARTRPRVASSREPSELAAPAPAAGHPFAGLAALRARVAPASAPSLSAAPDAWVNDVVEAPHAALRLDERGRIEERATGRLLAQIVGGASLVLPDVRVLVEGDIGAGARSRLQRRLLAFARDVVTELTPGLRELGGAAATPALRAVAHRLQQSLGTLRATDVEDLTRELAADERARLAAVGVHVGNAVLYVAAGLRADALASRVALAAAYYRPPRAFVPPAGGAVSFPAPRGVHPDVLAAVGYPVFGRRAVRADVADLVASRLRAATDAEPVEPARVASWLGCPLRDVGRVVADLAGPR